nr:Chain G, ATPPVSQASSTT O-GlcNac peptide [synthetic construct]6BYK_J Chain J, ATPPVSQASSTT O-GlcNac peptide [synthetic construct]6BYK_K Chain K, ATPPVSQASSTT O-GlcNac peptide [synthetic construct]6BYK_R Chain R, ATPPVSQASSTT O-GlcNac peptide [synthetic construct]
ATPPVSQASSTT